MNWNIDASHSTVEFSVKHMMISTTKGRFEKVTGTALFDEQDPGQSQVEAVIEAASLNSNDPKRDGHLKGADFFDVETYPTIAFKSTRVEKLSEEEYRVYGNLTIKDVTKPVTLQVETPVKDSLLLALP